MVCRRSDLFFMVRMKRILFFYANFDQSTLRMSPDDRNSVWKASDAWRVWGVWPP